MSRVNSPHGGGLGVKMENLKVFGADLGLFYLWESGHSGKRSERLENSRAR